MSFNLYKYELQNWFLMSNLDEFIRFMVHFNTDFELTIFKNANNQYSFYLSNGEFGDRILSTPEFQNVCETQNFGIIKEIIMILKEYLHQNGFDGELKVGQIL